MVPSLDGFMEIEIPEITSVEAGGSRPSIAGGGGLDFPVLRVAGVPRAFSQTRAFAQRFVILVFPRSSHLFFSPGPRLGRGKGDTGAVCRLLCPPLSPLYARTHNPICGGSPNITV